MIYYILPILILLINSRAQTQCTNQYIDFLGNCIQSCSTIPGAMNPTNIGDACICQPSTNLLNSQKNQCVAQCADYQHPHPLKKYCVANCSVSISGSINPSTFGQQCLCVNTYLSNDGTSCISSCTNAYYSLNKKMCINDCTIEISGGQNPLSKNQSCMCSQTQSYISIDGMSCVTSCQQSYKHVDNNIRQCYKDCSTTIQNSINPPSYNSQCICNGTYQYLSLSKMQCLSACPTNSSAVNNLCKCSSPYNYISQDGLLCVNSCPLYISLDSTNPTCVSDCSLYYNSNAQNPLSTNSICLCNLTSPYLDIDVNNQLFCTSTCNYYQQNIGYTCVSDCNAYQGMTNPSQHGMKCICASNTPYLQANLISCGTTCLTTYQHLNTSIKQCFTSCSTSFPNSSNPLNPDMHCQCKGTYPYISSDYSSCVSACPNYLHFNMFSTSCVTDCPTAIANSQNPQNVGDRCICPQNTPYLSIDNLSCQPDCSTSYINLLGTICVQNCQQYINTDNPSLNNQKCNCNSSIPYFSFSNDQCISSCTYANPNSLSQTCFDDCTAFPGGSNPATVSLPCICNSNTPLLDVKADRCVVQCPQNAIVSQSRCSCSGNNSNTQYLQSDYSACVASCPDYTNPDHTTKYCIADCPSSILGSVNPSSLGQKCKCPQSITFLKRDQFGELFCSNSCSQYHCDYLCTSDCTLFANMANPQNVGMECICADSTQFFDRENRQCVSQCSNYIHLTLNECVSNCQAITGAAFPSAPQTRCICASSTPYLMADGLSCVSSCPNFYHPNPQILKCYDDCSKILNASNPTNGGQYCQCNNVSLPFFGKDNNNNLACISSCPLYYFQNLCLDNCSYISNTQTPQTGYECTCSSAMPFSDPFQVQCVQTCPNYIHLDINKDVCVQNCNDFANSSNPTNQGERCYCGDNSFPFIQSSGNSCVSQCTDYMYLKSSIQMCVQDCPTLFTGSQNPLFGGYQCVCSISNPYKSLDQLSCIASCPQTTTSINGVCKCSGSTPYYSEDGKSCVSTCPNYINPDPSKQLCIQQCSNLSRFSNPQKQGRTCVCLDPYKYISYDYSSCESDCPGQYLHLNTNLCIKDCPSYLTNTVNPSKYQSRCTCNPSYPYIRSDNQGCVAICPDYIDINPNINICVSDCSLIVNAENPSSTGQRCKCKQNTFLNVDGVSCVSSCPQYSNDRSGVCTCTQGYNTSSKNCNLDQNATKSFSIILKISLMFVSLFLFM